MNDLQIRRKVAKEMIEQMGYASYRDYLFAQYNNAKGNMKGYVMKQIRALNYVLNHRLVEE